ncbi:UDP-N-acetylmuramyl tripeptide synthase [Rheinheimera sp. A13L]|uniref:Mur ligase family protein n=1 Tax=Rheinheimera sp. A13L TaxID=506534 RepID=UPI0002124B9F|nr:Mur ligase family protein [Rheinheimera sp. A13L]EGM79044.1 UDP-N-acetylmuramyl tripeptide synthase [Rheinheimera sp. A13L]
MKILNSRFLRGPNIYAMEPCFVTLIDLKSHSTVGVEVLQEATALIHKLMPGSFAPIAIDQCEVPWLLVRLTCAAQAWLGSTATFCNALAFSPSTPNLYRLISGYQHEAVAEAALRLAVGFITAILHQQQFDLEGQLDELKKIADTSAHSPATFFSLNTKDHIPVVAVTGTNGKTTTTLLISHVLRASGLRTGTTTTQGIYIDGQCVKTGDCSGYWSARRVLSDSSVQVATLETARGGILKRGLGFDRCDVAVVLNVSSDHLGLDGIETLEDLAQVKGLVARCARDSVVLNADDALCVAMRDSLAPRCKAVFFAMDPRNPVLLEHLRSGGAAACLNDDGWLLWCHGSESLQLIQAVDLPFTMQGHARYNIANALAAFAALCCLGLEPTAIARSLACFVSNAQSNPLRGNLFEIDGVLLIVDYAHNAVAYSALCEMAQSMRQGNARLLGVITAPGDRRSEDLYNTGLVCGQNFDELVVYEHDPRGRSSGGIASEILRGARSIAPNKLMHGEPGIRQALWLGLSAARPGDVLVFTCAGTLDDLVEGIRLKNPAEANRIALGISA